MKKCFVVLFVFLFQAGAVWAQTANMTAAQQAHFLAGSLGKVVPQHYTASTEPNSYQYTIDSSRAYLMYVSGVNKIVYAASMGRVLPKERVGELVEELKTGLTNLTIALVAMPQTEKDENGNTAYVWYFDDIVIYYGLKDIVGRAQYKNLLLMVVKR